ncbi:hypothetical protein [Allorhizobium undicola]|uniref:hypothetical protein n=1 Tax=Allorhizobium undicola TaxID=78527 RepID=UPI000480C6CF|nr:hypothetical protein [Allorhizobium undicola]
MKKVVLWAIGGFGLAVICGLMGLAHLSASIVTLTVFCATPAILFHFSAWCFGFIGSLPDRILSWLHPPGAVVGLGEERDR